MAKLPIRQQKFVKALAQTGKVHESAMRAGYTDGHYGTELLRNEKIRAAVLLQMERAGVTNELLMQKLREGLDAKYPDKVVVDKAGVEHKIDGGTDFFTRKHYLEQALRLKNAYPAEKGDTAPRTVNIIISEKAIAGLMDAGAIVDGDIIDVPELTA
jgi:phage terminase small subunit